nr:hypothetical protein B0A51_10411 [Rachicladosporium sp. CCFEE 5018]
MVVNKGTPPSLLRTASAPKLPPLPKLRVRRPEATNANPCIAMMSSVLGCWASQGYTTQGCAALEQSLRVCMDARKPQQAMKNPINTHLSRLYPQIKGPTKRK